MRKLMAALGVVLVSVPFFAGCDSISFTPGEYQVLRIATVTQPALGADCMAMPDPNHTMTTNLRAGATVTVYGVSTDAGDQFFLDTGKDTLQGALQSDGTYQFIGKTTTVDKQQLGMGNDETITKIDTTTITLTLAGDTVQGKVVGVASRSCAGTPCQPAQTGSCTESTTFVGVAVQGADVQK